MKICLIGDYSSNLDEGLKNIAHYTAIELSKENDVTILNIKKPFSINFIKTLLTTNAKVFHYFTGPTLSSFILLKIIGLKYRKSKRVISALHPKSSMELSKNKIFKKFSNFLKPDIILVQEPSSKRYFDSIGYATRYGFNGVDTKKFHPMSKEEKNAIRKKYDIDTEKYVLLHVGHLSRVRNIQIFEKLQHDDFQVVIVGSTYLGIDNDLCDNLVKKGCKILKGYHKDINEIYSLSDCYVFPVEKGNSIIMPLSVLEAMACNLPVISTKYDGLINAFKDKNGLFFEDDINKYFEIVRNLRDNTSEINTRDYVLRYSWDNICNDLIDCYSSL